MDIKMKKVAFFPSLLEARVRHKRVQVFSHGKSKFDIPEDAFDIFFYLSLP